MLYRHAEHKVAAVCPCQVATNVVEVVVFVASVQQCLHLQVCGHKSIQTFFNEDAAHKVCFTNVSLCKNTILCADFC